MWKLMEILNVFNALTLKNIFWKTRTFFKKWAYRFLDESTKIANAIFPYKTALSEANVKTKWGVQNAPITKNEVFASIYLIFVKILFHFKNFLSSWCDVPTTENHIYTFLKRWSFIWGWLFLVNMHNVFRFLFFCRDFIYFKISCIH